MNKCQRFAGICCNPFSDSSSCSLSYSSFTDNNALRDICIQLDGGTNYEMACCDILRNEQSSSSHGVIYATRNLMIKDSCILENKATNIFYASSTITISNCTIDNITNYGSLTVQNTVTKSFILELKHIYTRNCHSEYGAVEYSTKKLFCYTGKMNHYQARISDFFSFNCLFMITFIDPNPPG